MVTIVRKYTQILTLVLITFLVPNGRTIYADDGFQPGEYGKLADELVLIRSQDSGRVTVIDPQGVESSPRISQLEEISDHIAAADGNANRIRSRIQQLTQDIAALRKRLVQEYDTAFLEMMTACLVATEQHNDSRSLKDCLIAAREARLQSIVEDCKNLDIDRFVGIVTRCEFHKAFVDYAHNHIVTTIRQAERQVRWLEAESSTQSDDRRQPSQDQIRAKKELNVRLTQELEPLGRSKSQIAETLKCVDSLQKEYFHIYEKATEVWKQYAILRERIAQEQSISDERSNVRMLSADWSGSLLTSATSECGTDAKSALEELNRRRKRNTHVPSATSATRQRGSKELKALAVIGCFIVLIVVVVLRRLL